MLRVFGLYGLAVLLGFTLIGFAVGPGVPVGRAQVYDGLEVALGKALFERLWVSSPASTEATDGLGPLFNARSCGSCHADGHRGGFAFQDDGAIAGLGILLRLGSAAGRPDPVYGAQLQTLAVQGHKAEGEVYVDLEELDFPAGALTLRRPLFNIFAPNFGPLATDMQIAGRVAPALFASSAIENIDGAAILALEDPGDADGDGISGRINWRETPDGPAIGRFGWKAGEVSLTAQSARAFLNDVGLSTPRLPFHSGECTESQSACLEAPNGASAAFDDAEVSEEMLTLIDAYMHSLAMTPDPALAETPGAGVFKDSGCAACHQPSLPDGAGEARAIFSDILLHDMGEGLADGIAEGLAEGSEWRTAPLIGLGVLLDQGAPLLHDGRAATLDEALAWHGGEAAGARQAFFALDAVQREQLLTFLRGL